MALEENPFQIDHLLRDLSAIISSYVGSKPVELLFAIDPALPATLIGDSLRLRQVLLNLMSNAVKFTTRGEVVISLRQISHDSTTTEIEFSVRDTGIGIAADKMRTIFDSFSQAEASTARRYGGTGLGLTICQRLVALMGGQLQIESETGVGSRFFFTLQLRNSPVADSKETRPVLHTLLIEDHATARSTLQSMIESLGWQCAPVANIEAALSLLQARELSGQPCDAIFVDWTLPGTDGWQAAKRIRALQPRITAPIIVLATAHDQAMLAEKMQAEPACTNGVLTKPVTASMLFNAVSDAMSNRPTKRYHGNGLLAGVHLLVVEDNPLNQQVALGLLSAEGADVMLAGDGQTCIEQLSNADLQFDAVLMDIQMPGMDGYETARQIRLQPQLAKLPIIAMTANAMAADREACLAAGMNDHVGKPINLDTLIATLLRNISKPASTPSDGSPQAPREIGPDAEIDYAAALARLGGNASLLASIIDSFRQDAPAMLAEMRQKFSEAATADGMRLLHTLKGTAATVGAARLAQYATEKEALLRQHFDRLELETMLTEMEYLLPRACAALCAISGPVSREESSPAAPFNSEQFMADLAKLETLLQDGDMRATSYFTESRQRSGWPDGPLPAKLQDAINRLDFSQALDICRQLREEY